MSKIAFKFILLFYPFFVFAQFEPVRNFSVKDGLPSGVVYDCLQDKQGFIWFATAAGLARFDGFNFKVFTTEDGLTNNEVLQVALDPDGSIWIFPFGTTGCIYDPATQKFYNEKNYSELQKIKDLKPSTIIRNSASGLIGHSVNETFFLENKKIRFIKHGRDVWPVNSDSIILFPDFKSCYLFANNDSTVLDFPIPEIDINFSKSPDWGRWKIFINSSETTELSLYEYTNDGSVTQRALFRSDHLISSVTKYDRKIYITTVNGIYVTDTLLTQLEYFFPGKNISKAFVDKNGNEWLCSLSGDGVYMRLKNRVKQFNTTSGLPVDNITSLKINKDNLLICGDEKGNVYKIDPDEQIIKPFYITKLPNAIRGIELHKNSFLAYSNYKLFSDNKLLPENFGAIKSVIADANDNLLVGSHSWLTLYNEENRKFDIIGEGPRFTALAYTDNKLYYGNNKGLFEKADYKSLFYETPVKNKSEVLRQPVNHLLSTIDGILWIATNNDGIVAYLKDRIIGHFNTLSSPAMTSNICKKIFFDKENNSIWVVTNKGLNKISYKLRRDSLSAVINSITSSEGLNDDDVNDVCVKDGEVYAATIKGICVFNVDLSQEKIPIRIIDIVIKDYSSDSTSSVRLNYDLKYSQNNISISYTAICFTCNNKLVYRYRMLGIGNDTLWKTTTANTVEFGELKKGRYTFQVRTDLGNMQELRFYIRPAFWQTNLFYLFVAIAVLGLFFFLIRYITGQIRKREIEKTTINKKFAELEFQALQAQMNPHFVFNAMNTLQNYILKNESENASEYLAKFARLMRLFLESSRNKFIELRNEIELLRNYIELEQTRLQYSFKYEINIDPNVEMDARIPSVMIQPFVENAILHGIRHKTDANGLLELHFSAWDHMLACQIRDNGIGRAESAIINSTKDKLYKSQALSIIDEKVKTLKEISNVDIKISIEDVINDNGDVSGTTVIIQFGPDN